MNKEKLTIIIISVVIFLALIFSTVLIYDNKNKEVKVENTDALKIKEEYESLNKKDNGEVNYINVKINKENPIVYTTPKEVIDKINNKDLFVVYFGNSKKNENRQIVESLLESAKEKEVDKIYYIDTRKYENDLEDLRSLLKEISGKEDDYTSVPSVIAISKKKIVQYETGIDTDKDIKAYSKNKFNCLFKCLAEESTTCKKNSC